MTKKEKAQIGVILCSVLLIVVAIIGNTYAYFTSTITGNDTAKDTVITTGTMKIVYTNTQEIKGEKLLPGWKSEEKTFTVQNVGTLPVNYDIKLTNITNTFQDTIDGVVGKPEELVFKLTGDNDISIAEQQFPTEEETLSSNITIEPNTTHTYTMQVTFKEMGAAQDYNQEREFKGKIEIVGSSTEDPVVEASEPEAPDLNNGLIPVVYENNTWKKADTSKEWYNYYNQEWANAVTVSSSTRSAYISAQANTEIKMEDIETMWVWVPRYEYQHTNLGEQYAGGTKTLPGEIEINFISKDVTTPSSDNFTVHDAFWWDNNNDGVKDASEQLSGIWVAKFQMSATNPTSNTLQNPVIKPNVVSWRNAQIATFWTAIHNNMNGTDNTYGLTNSDAHLMKNMEWGAVTYLSQSKYGKYGNANYTGANKEIYKNNSSSYYTGRSSGLPPADGKTANGTYSYDGRTCTTATCNTETINKTSEGYGASTTGNIYGIYDMSGGAYEYVMGIMKESTNTEPAVGNSSTSMNSGWSGKLYNDGKWTSYTGTYGNLKDIGSKYYDLYDYGEDYTDTTRYHKGDATYETSKWYSDSASFVYSSNPFFVRGGHQSYKTNVGIFFFAIYNGSANTYYGGRPVVVSAS